MAFVTYILLVGFFKGINNEFTPEILGVTASACLLALTIQVLILRLGFYLLDAEDTSLCDLISYCGYIFVAEVFTGVFGIILGSYVYYAVMIVIGLFNAIFMVKTLRTLIRAPQLDNMSSGAGNVRNYFLLAVAAAQLLWVYCLRPI